MALALSSSSTAPSSSFPQGATPPNFVMTPAQLTAAVLNLGQQMAGIRDLLLQRSVAPPPPLPEPSATLTALPYPATAETAAPAPPPGGVPIHMMTFPPSPSPIPEWSSSAPAYTMAPARTSSTAPPRAPPRAPASQAGRSQSGVLYGGADGALFSAPAGTQSWEPPLDDTDRAFLADQGAAQGRAPPRFYKLELPTYDGSVDLLNWLTQCEQFF